MKRHWKREVKYLYPFILKSNGYVVDIKEAIGYYDKYAAFAEEIFSDPNCPDNIKKCLVFGPEEPKMPKYLQWAKERLVKKS